MYTRKNNKGWTKSRNTQVIVRENPTSPSLWKKKKGVVPSAQGFCFYRVWEMGLVGSFIPNF